MLHGSPCFDSAVFEACTGDSRTCAQHVECCAFAGCVGDCAQHGHARFENLMLHNSQLFPDGAVLLRALRQATNVLGQLVRGCLHGAWHVVPGTD
jgi:hypothetical protein